MEQLSSSGWAIDGFVSEAGFYVLRMYGLWKRFAQNVTSLALEHLEKPVYQSALRVWGGTYAAVVIAPCTTNTVAKLVEGIADTLVTCVATYARKTKTPLVVAPADVGERRQSLLPPYIDQRRCKRCEDCVAAKACPREAIWFDGRQYHIDLRLCNGCARCKEACPYEAVVIHERIEIRIRPFDKRLVERLYQFPEIMVATTIERIATILQQIMTSAQDR